jgi:hypothetical protein
MGRTAGKKKANLKSMDPVDVISECPIDELVLFEHGEPFERLIDDFDDKERATSTCDKCTPCCTRNIHREQD